jgi:glutamate-5-semialdehyde dehydrogenase
MNSADMTDVTALMAEIGSAARAVAPGLAAAPAAQKEQALHAAASAMRASVPQILAANARDMAEGAAQGLTPASLDRLRLDAARVEGIAAAVELVASLPDPVGRELARWQRPNGLDIARVAVPLGVIGIIYESRPNVTADAGALCLKSGNAAILRGGSECLQSSLALHGCLVTGLVAAGLPASAIQLVPTTDRAAVGAMLRMSDFIDVIVPRGGKSLVARVQADARVPVLAHLDGNCHVYVDAEADLEMARTVVLNAKLRRTGVCGAAETLLVDRAVADSHLAPLVKALLDAGCAVRGDAATRTVDARVSPVAPEDWDTEYLDAVIAVGLVDGVEGAMNHIARHGSHHTDAIITGNAATAERFLAGVDSAIVLVNASTQFADGGEFGFGAEIGIATGRLHARGPVGPEQLTTFKYVVRGVGQTRP